jgi:hypothetical protein
MLRCWPFYLSRARRGRWFAVLTALALVTSRGEIAVGQVVPDNLPSVVPAQKMETPPPVRAWYRNPDGSCVQCSLGMCGVWNNVPAASTLLWDTPYGPRVRGGSWPSRVSDYARTRGIPLYNVTGETTLAWLEWAGRTGRFAAFAAGPSHFQTLAGFDPATRRWLVCDNNSPTRLDEYSDAEFRRLHRAGGAWCVVLDTPASAALPRYER